MRLLQREIAFLKKKDTLSPITAPVPFLGMRPASFQTIRLVQLAMLMHQSSHLFSKVLKEENLTWVPQPSERNGQQLLALPVPV